MVFPQDLLENWFEAKNFAMLGLGDIVIPGIFVAILLRYDYRVVNEIKAQFGGQLQTDSSFFIAVRKLLKV